MPLGAALTSRRVLLLERPAAQRGGALFFVKNGSIRADGRMMREMYLFEVKQPAESKYAWDYYKLKATIPAAEAFIPAEKSVCPLLKK